jgi:hypothetical protein
MTNINFDQPDRQLCDRAREVFAASIKDILYTDYDVSDLHPLRAAQVKVARWMRNSDTRTLIKGTSSWWGRLVPEICWTLIVAVEQDDPLRVSETLGSILLQVCAVCTSHRLDFVTIAKDFDPNALEAPQGLEGVLSLVKGVGFLGQAMTDAEHKLDQIIIALTAICAATHWLAFSNDWEPSVLFQEVLAAKMKD